ncbi:hypothetical protein HYC85_020259 [Camellia sinensis]|uniref:Uncharacterized protein n=1 Tax=Camellia sinensis TaxID=4442 RepID=A0A7J7GQ54_CAMSI|nr:hypothetical protein HYC85_020259 [Camellia sinensis]
MREENKDILAELPRRESEPNIKRDLDIDIFTKAAATEGQEPSVVTDYILKVLKQQSSEFGRLCRYHGSGLEQSLQKVINCMERCKVLSKNSRTLSFKCFF